MDLLSKGDRDQMREHLTKLFEPMGTTDQFLVIAFGKEDRVSVIQFQNEGCEDHDIKDLISIIADGTPDEDSFLEF